MKKLTIAEKFQSLLELLEKTHGETTFKDGTKVVDFLQDRLEKSSSKRSSSSKASKGLTKTQKENIAFGKKLATKSLSYFNEKGVDMASASQLFEHAGYFDYSSQKQTSIMTTLMKAGIFEKSGKVKDENGREKVGYSLTEVGKEKLSKGKQKVVAKVETQQEKISDPFADYQKQ